MVLSDGQAAALRNLGRKHAGHEVDWIGIADARQLTEMGLAVRSREGWDITPAGLEALEALDPGGRAQPAPPTPFRPDGG